MCSWIHQFRHLPPGTGSQDAIEESKQEPATALQQSRYNFPPFFRARMYRLDLPQGKTAKNGQQNLPKSAQQKRNNITAAAGKDETRQAAAAAEKNNDKEPHHILDQSRWTAIVHT